MHVTVTKDGALRLEVHAKPRAKKSRIVGVADGRLELALAAAPAEGAANEELVELLAKRLGCPRRDVVILRGASSRHKLVEVRGVSEEALRRLLSAP